MQCGQYLLTGASSASRWRIKPHEFFFLTTFPRCLGDRLLGGPGRNYPGPQAKDVVHLPPAARPGPQHDRAVLGATGRGETAAFAQHPVLGPRLVRISQALRALPGHDATRIMRSPDDVKLRSSMTLFAALPGLSTGTRQILPRPSQWAHGAAVAGAFLGGRFQGGWGTEEHGVPSGQVEEVNRGCGATGRGDGCKRLRRVLAFRIKSLKNNALEHCPFSPDSPVPGGSSQSTNCGLQSKQ